MFKKPIIVILIFMLLLSSTGCNTTLKKVEYDMNNIDTKVTQGNEEFAFNIFRELNKEEIGSNVFISPFSISTALSMTYNGAEGKTKEDMAKALYYGGINIANVNSTYMNLLPYLSNIDKDVDLDISNSIWYRLGEPIKEEFITNNKDAFDAEISEIDFSQPDAANRINNWIKDSTKGKIEKMLEPPIPSDVIMYLINAVYFKGNWTYEFDKENTYPAIFRNIDGEEDDVMVGIPRYKVEYGIKNLNDVLKKMGMTSAFEMNADFSKIRDGIFISRVLHKAVIDVNEEGSEAAAVTVVEMMESAMEEPTTFVADRPFVFSIRDEDTGTMLFMGKYCKTK